MKKQLYYVLSPLFLIFYLFSQIGYSNTPEGNRQTQLLKARTETVQRYLHDLETANAGDIVKLFEPGGTVYSTSRGTLNAEIFFQSFLPHIDSAQVNVHTIFVEAKKPSANSEKYALAARFHFSWKMKDGEVGAGEYMDEFLFPVNSAKLSKVSMFENTK